MGAIIRDPKDNRKQARVGTPSDGTNPGDGITTHSINWLTEPISGIRRLWRSNSAGAAIVAGDGDVKDVTLTLDTAAYVANDVLADTQEVANVFAVVGGRVVIQSITLNDKSDQQQGLRLLFLRSNKSIGTENDAPNISDDDADEILGWVDVSAGDYLDIGGCSIVSRNGIGMMVKAAAGSTSLYIAAISNGTGTYSANGITLKIGVLGV